MFVHRDNLSASKLLTNNHARILTMEQIGSPAPPNKSGQEPIDRILLKTFTSLCYVRVPLNTNGDKVLDERDRQQIGISEVSGANYTEIIKNIDKILLVHLKGIVSMVSYLSRW